MSLPIVKWLDFVKGFVWVDSWRLMNKLTVSPKYNVLNYFSSKVECKGVGIIKEEKRNIWLY